MKNDVKIIIVSKLVSHFQIGMADDLVNALFKLHEALFVVRFW